MKLQATPWLRAIVAAYPVACQSIRRLNMLKSEEAGNRVGIAVGAMSEHRNSRPKAPMAVLAGLVSICFALAAKSQNGASITGVIKDNAGKPAAGAMVQARNDGRQFAVTVISQDGGRYRIANLPPGNYTVRARGGGWESGPAPIVELNGSGTARRDLAFVVPLDFRNVASATEGAALLPEDGPAKELILAECTGCHFNGFDHILFARKARAGWNETLETMRNRPYGRGDSAIFSDEQKPILLDYLAKHFGAEKSPFDPQANAPKIWIKGEARKGVITEFDMPPINYRYRDFVVDSKGIGWTSSDRAGVMLWVDPKSHTVTRIPMPEGSGAVTAIDPQDRLWLGGPDRMTRYDPTTNEFTAYELPKPPRGVAGLNTVVVHPDGSVWGTQIMANRIFRLDPESRKVSFYAVPTEVPPRIVNGKRADTERNPYGMAIDTNHFVWFAQKSTGKLGRIEPRTGEIAEYDVPTKDPDLRRMAADDRGNVWYAVYAGGGKLGVIDTRTSSITEYPSPTLNSAVYAVSVDRTRNRIWVPEYFADQIARFDPRARTWIEYRVPSRNAGLRRIQVDPTRPNRIWFLEGDSVSKFAFLDVTE